MDLYGFGNAEGLDRLAAANGISVPRVRGYRLMEKEKPVTEAEIREAVRSMEMHTYVNAVLAVPTFDANSHEHELSARTDALMKRYLVYSGDDDGSPEICRDVIGFRWDRLHGRRRRALKLAVKQARRRTEKEIRIFNKHCGQKGVLCIYARIGGWNRTEYGGAEIARKPWFIEKADDAFDSTYCSIYARIGGQDAG